MAIVVRRTIFEYNQMNIVQLMRPSVKDDWGIKDLQNCILNIAKYIQIWLVGTRESNLFSVCFTISYFKK